MALTLYNTLTGKKEPFEPLEPGKVGMYACGVTVYDMCHIGHARQGVVFDVIARYLRHLKYELTYVKNFTDLDDKIIKRANEEGLDAHAVAERYIAEFYTDMDALGIARPDEEPRVTEAENMQAIVDLVQELIDKGKAYAVEGGDVFYDVHALPDYGKLSGRKIDEMEAGARIAVDERKRHPGDFALWKSSKEGEPAWESPWGPGRPGWHIECSAMSMRLLGKTFDIHGGGKDLIFPHHENEIAQSEGATGQQFAKYWLHNGFVNINQEKMSKSLGNFFTIREVLKLYHPEVVRFFLLSVHYRSPIDYSDENLREAQKCVCRLYSTLRRMDEWLKQGEAQEAGTGVEELSDSLKRFVTHFEQAMNDDFNTAGAIAGFFDFCKELNKYLDDHKKKDMAGGMVVQSARDLMSNLGAVLGLLTRDPNAFFNDLKAGLLEQLGMSENDLQSLIGARAEARKTKNFAEADRIRDELLAKGIALKDSREGTTWEVDL